jgi:hypothetical protein
MESGFFSALRPGQVDQFVGRDNRRRLRDILAELHQRRWGGPLAVVAPFGMGKTSACRLISAALCCTQFAKAGEPCGACAGCRSQRPDHNGDRHRYRHWELDCASLPPGERIRFQAEVIGEDRGVVTLDEVAALEPADQRSLLKFCEDFRGVLLAAVMVDHDGEPLDRKLIPPLAERFRQLRLTLPGEDELTRAFTETANAHGVPAHEADVRLMVRAAGRKFRKCLQVLDRARQAGGLTRAVIADALALPPGWDDDPEE